jgi:hypothetical protein
MLLLSLLATLGAGWLLAPTPALVLTDDRTGAVLAWLPADGPVTMRYVHSLVRQPAAEVFAVEPAGLRLVRLVSPSEAVLEYYARVEPIRPLGDAFVIEVVGEAARPLTALASALGRRSVESGGRAVVLHEVAPHGTPIRLTIETRPRALTLLAGGSGGWQRGP